MYAANRRWVLLRYKSSWTSPLAKQKRGPQYYRDLKAREAAKLVPPLLADVRPHLRTNVPPKEKLEQLRQLLAAALVPPSEELRPLALTQEDMSILSQVFREIDKGTPLSLDEVVLLFMTVAPVVLAFPAPPGGRVAIPKFMSQFIATIIRAPQVDNEVLVQLVRLGALKTNLLVSLAGLVHTRSQLAAQNPEFAPLTPKFIGELITSLGDTVTLATFEDIAGACQDHLHLLGDTYLEHVVRYVEQLFGDGQVPAVHEYKDLERNVDRILLLVNTVVDQMDTTTLKPLTVMTVAKMVYELDLVSPWEPAQASITTLMQSLAGEGCDRELRWHEIRQEIFKQDWHDEGLVELVLLLAHRHQPTMAAMLREFVAADSVKFSPGLRLQCFVYGQAHLDQLEAEITSAIQAEIERFHEEVDPEAETREPDVASVVQAALTASKIPPRGYFYQTMVNEYPSNVYVYKYFIDRALADNNYTLAINLFDDSLEKFTDWALAADPAVQATLNNLIKCLCDNVTDIMAIFPIFTKIKQQMLVQQCRADVIMALARRMLDAELVGDTIEMLKRELPKIDPDLAIKLPSNQPYGVKYAELAAMLHHYVVSFANDSTTETNWVLYGELHKYFHLDHATYLPAMKFFCQHDRLNAALIILRQVKRLNELHGDHRHLPPTREMYQYLFEQFGDQLYEDGVIEVHEYLKTDVSIDTTDLALQNTILNAYANLQDVSRTRDLFLAIAPLGINAETAQIMIKAYTYNDLDYVTKFYNNLSKFGIIPDDKIAKQYLIAHVYHGHVDEALQLTLEFDADFDIPVTSDTVLALHNYCIDEAHQRKVGEWAMEHHPAAWLAAQLLGLLRSATNYVPDTNLLAESSL